jgi:GNAT superfamily N-acetyltransferase
MPLSIRRAKPADVPLILQFIKDLAEYERDPLAVVATEASLHQHLFGTGLAPHRAAAPTAECLIGEVDSIPHGFAVFFHNFSTWKGRPGMYLEDLFVRPEARGAGLGKALLAAVAKIAHDRGCPRLEWAVLDWNTPAIDFYVALGAKPMSEWTIFRMDQPAIAKLAASSEPLA